MLRPRRRKRLRKSVTLELIGLQGGQSGCVEVLGLGVIHRADPAQHDMFRRHRCGSGKNLVAFAENPAQRHAVERPCGRGLWGVQIWMGVEPQDGEIAVCALHRAVDGRDFDSAPATDADDRLTAGLKALTHTLADGDD